MAGTNVLSAHHPDYSGGSATDLHRVPITSGQTNFSMSFLGLSRYVSSCDWCPVTGEAEQTCATLSKGDPEKDVVCIQSSITCSEGFNSCYIEDVSRNPKTYDLKAR